MEVNTNKLKLLATRLNTNIDNLNKNKKFMHIPQKIIDEFVDIYIDLQNEIRLSGGDNNGRRYKDYSISKEL